AGRPSARNKAATLASLSDDVEIKRVNFQLPADQHTKLKIYAAKQGKTIKELLTEYVAALPE
ncbi:chromosome partitioning protein ParB, partial [Pseudomonas sp. FSL R10-2245]